MVRLVVSAPRRSASAAPQPSMSGSPPVLRLSSWADVVQELALLHAKTGEWVEAERHLTRVTDVRQIPWTASLGEPSAQLWARESLRDALVLLASVQTHLGRREDAQQNLARAAEEYREHAPDDFVSLVNEIAAMPDDALGLKEEALRTVNEQKQTHVRLDLASLALSAAKQGRWEEALGLAGSLLDLARQGADAAPGEKKPEEALAWAHEVMGGILHDQGVFDGAVLHFGHAAGIRHMLTELDPNEADAQRSLAEALRLQAVCLAMTGSRPSRGGLHDQIRQRLSASHRVPARRPGCRNRSRRCVGQPREDACETR